MVKEYASYISLREAREILRRRAEEKAFFIEKNLRTVKPHEAVGFCLGDAVHALRNIPHYHASAVDGFALRAEDSLGATEAVPKTLPSEKFVFLNTGAPVPPVFDTVVMVEDVFFDETQKTISLQEPLKNWEHIRTIGEDVVSESVLGRIFQRVTPEMAALFVAAGVKEVKVLPPLRITFLPTGEELLSSEEWLQREPIPGAVGDTNSLLVKHTLESLGAEVVLLPPVKDDPDKIGEILASHIKDTDIFLIGAGTAKGKRDHTFKILETKGTVFFRGVRTKPGRPLLAGVIEKTLVFGLPGFSMSSLVSLWGAIAPLLFLYEKGFFPNEAEFFPWLFKGGEKTCPLLMPHSSPRGIAEWMRVRIISIDEESYAYPLQSGSSSLRSMAEADGVAVLPEESYEYAKKDSVQVWLHRPLSLSRRILYQGSNDPGIDLLQGLIPSHGGELFIRSAGSLGGLLALQRKEAHLAAIHLIDQETRTYNTPFIIKHEISDVFRKIIYWRTQGIIVGKGNPLDIRGIEDFLREDVHIVNRQIGTGTRSLLQCLMVEKNISPQDINGFHHLCSGHAHGAAMVAHGEVEAMIGIKAAADIFGLHFIPLCEEPFEIIIPQKYTTLPGIDAFFKTLEDPSWKKGIEKLGGYRWNNS